MIDVPFAYAFTVGMVATVNPCGFPMLPAYLSWFIGVEDGTGTAAGWTRVPRAVAAAAAVSAGFLAVFTVLGVPIHAGVTSIYRWMPWITMVIGAALVALGVAMLLGWRLPAIVPRLDRGGRSRRAGSMALFGVSYAVASLGCTLPLFLTVVANRPNPASGALAFLAYGLGMSSVLVALSLALAFARGSLLHGLRRLSALVDRVAGVLLVLVGGYLIWYWADNLSRDPDVTIGASPVRVVDDWSAWATGRLGDGGLTLGLVLGAMAVGALTVARLRRHPS